MWCTNCNIETNAPVCYICGKPTVEDKPIEIFWCKDCKIPIIKTEKQADKDTCPICNKKVKYLVTDLRPVFPEERLLLEIMLKETPNKYLESSVWACNNRYTVEYSQRYRAEHPEAIFQTAKNYEQVFL